MKSVFNKTVSIIVPVYNVEKHLPRCIDSILNQSFTDYELILVDDGSTDNSGKICDEYTRNNPSIKVIHTENKGVSTARNTGIRNSSGKYIMFVDSDDYIEPTMLGDMLKYNGSDIIISGYRTVDTKSNILTEFLCEEFGNISPQEFLNKYYIELDRKDILSGPINKLFSSEIIKSYDVSFDEDLSICEDGLFVLQFLSLCKTISSVKNIYYNYVQYGTDTLMCKYNTNAIEACEKRYLANIELLNKHSVLHDTIYDYVKNHNFYKFLYFLFQIYTRSGLNGKEKYKEMKKALSNSSFLDLILNSKLKDTKRFIFKILIKAKCFILLHLILSIYSFEE